jgi:hypothetical protein
MNSPRQRFHTLTGGIGVRALLTSAAVLMMIQRGPADEDVVLRDDQRWDWSLAHANPLHCLLQQSGAEYDVTLSSDHHKPGAVKIIIARDQKSAYRWAGHAHSVFQIVGHRLYYADYSIQGTGGAIVAVDLTTGKIAWRQPLQALGPIEHSKYFNRMNLEADANSVRVTGNESAGRYIEVKETATGRTVANHKLEADPAGGA